MTMSSSEVRKQLELFEFAPGKKASWATLTRMLPDVETALFFAKAFSLEYEQLSLLIKSLFNTKVITALMDGAHSVDLQDYIVDTVPSDLWPEDVEPDFTKDQVDSEILAQLWDNAHLVIAKSIKEVATKLTNVLDKMPSKEGSMVFSHLAKLNRQRPTIGTYQAQIKHPPHKPNLVILDVSGSMTESTIKQIVDDVVALSYKADASLAIVSNNTYVWEPGTYGTADVLKRAEYGGTQYETLFPLLEKSWGTVVTIADYDSSMSAKDAISRATGRIDRLLDISLVNRPTFLAECVGQLADEVEPVLIASSSYVLSY